MPSFSTRNDVLGAREYKSQGNRRMGRIQHPKAEVLIRPSYVSGHEVSTSHSAGRPKSQVWLVQRLHRGSCQGLTMICTSRLFTSNISP